MLGRLSLIALLPIFTLTAPASAATKEQKMEICKFGADDQKLTGAKRTAFLAKCMANRNDKRGPGPKTTTGAKPPAAPKPMAPAAAPAEPEEPDQPAEK